VLTETSLLASDYAQLPADALLFLSIRVCRAHVVTATAKVPYLPAGRVPTSRVSDESSELYWLAKHFADSNDPIESLLAGIQDYGWREVVYRRRSGHSGDEQNQDRPFGTCGASRCEYRVGRTGDAVDGSQPCWLSSRLVLGQREAKLPSARPAKGSSEWMPHRQWHPCQRDDLRQLKPGHYEE
jgi:hypothetical protein